MQINPDFLAERETKNKWKIELVQLHEYMKNQGDIVSLLTVVTNREAVAQRGELTATHYIYNL